MKLLQRRIEDHHDRASALNRPDAMNAFSAELRLALGQAFRELRADPEVRVAIVTGAGRAFCAGMDLKELSSGGEDASGFDKSVVGQDMAELAAEQFQAGIETCQAMIRRIQDVGGLDGRRG